MAFYQFSWFILFSPLFSFAVIIFGTRMWDLLSRPPLTQSEMEAAHEEHGTQEHGTQEATHGEHEGNELSWGGTEKHAGIPINKEELPGIESGEVPLEGGYVAIDDPQMPALTMGAKVSAYVAIFIMLLACIYSWLLLLNTTGVIAIAPPLPSAGITVLSYPWFQQGTASYLVAFHLDTLAIVMMVVVTTVSLLVHFYSQGYIDNSSGYARFFAYLSFFTFSMLTITFAENFLVMFVGWELVGLSSYLLIGYWFNKRAKPEPPEGHFFSPSISNEPYQPVNPQFVSREDRLSPASAAIEAFITTRVGDTGFIIGIMILFAATGTFQFSQLAVSVTHMNKFLLTAAMILVFCGAIGKSAQVPLHVWLPPAMEGPTPVSALIHAATMVAAGVYMVSRTFPLFAAAYPAAFDVVAWVGGITALFAALVALAQYDFKRVLAFSTISQLGYMFVGLGVAGTTYGPGPGMFHLFTHGFFKALLFLGAGSVIHALHHATHQEVQDMRKMGGLGSKMPITAITWLVATLSISGFPFFAGFYSKESIIGLAFDHGYYALWAITLFTAGLTAFYMLRAFILAFGGKGGSYGGLIGGPYRGEHEERLEESSGLFTIPLVLLAIASIAAGYWFGIYNYIQPSAHPFDFNALLSDWKTWVGVAVSLTGLGWAYTLYTRFEFAAIGAFVERHAALRVAHRILLRKFYVDEFYNLLIRYVVLGACHVAQAFDTYIVDGIVNGVAELVTATGRDLRRVETGRVQSYMVGFFGGVAVLAIFVIVLITFVK